MELLQTFSFLAISFLILSQLKNDEKKTYIMVTSFLKRGNKSNRCKHDFICFLTGWEGEVTNGVLAESPTCFFMTSESCFQQKGVTELEADTAAAVW